MTSSFALGTLLFLLSGAAAMADDPLTAAEAARKMAEAAQLSSALMSPDGAWVTYTVTQRSVEKNELSTRRMLQRIPREGEALAEAVQLPLAADATGVQWRPDSKCLSVILRKPESADGSFACHHVATHETTPIFVRGEPVTENYKWSPHGNYVAFVAPLPERAPLDQRRGVPHGLIEPGRPMALFVLDVRTGLVAQLTPDRMNVASIPSGNFEWSPDERALALAIDDEPDGWGKNSDLVLIDRKTKHISPLVTRPGQETMPCWSPDGRWIAFATHQKDHAYRHVGWPAVVRAKGGPVLDFPRASTPMGFVLACHWLADNRTFHYVSPLEMNQRLVRVDRISQRVAVSPQLSNLPLGFEDNYSFSTDQKLVAFTRESPSTPPDLFVAGFGTEKNDGIAPIRLTNLARNFGLRDAVYAEEVSWPSTDGRFTVHGLLLTPAGARQVDNVGAKLPTLVFIVGGPSMVRRSFAQDGWNAYVPLAARGYAVLIPNTRGRGGYGAEFHDAIGTGKNRGRDPLTDALAGLDMLIARGLSDPERTGILGFSYGGYLTAYAITQTDRFKAAVIQDGLPFFLTWGGQIGFRPGSWRSLLQRDLFGTHNPFEATERARLIDESPGLHVDHVRTPTMLLAAGEKGPAGGPYGARFPSPVTDSIPFYNGLRRFKVPAALLIYDEGHVFQRPAAIQDNFTRTAEWLDFWVRNMPFPDAVRAAEYGEKEWGQ